MKSPHFRFWSRLLLRLVLWGGTFVLAVAGFLLNLCFKSVPEPSEYWPEKWVSVQSLKPEVQGWAGTFYRHPLAFAVRAVPPESPDYHNYLPLQVVSALTLERSVMEDLCAAQTLLAQFEKPWEVGMEEILLVSTDLEWREFQLRRAQRRLLI